MMAANERRLVPPEQRRSVGVFQLAVVAMVGFVLGVAVALNHSDAVRQLEASTAGTPDGFTGLQGLRSSAEPCPCAAAEGNWTRLASHPAELPARVVEQVESEQAESEQAESEQAESEQAESEHAESEQAESEQAESETSDVALPPGAEVAQAGMLSGLAEEVGGPAARGEALSLEAAVRAASPVGEAVIFVLVTAGNLACLHNWYASVVMAGYGLQAVFVAEDALAYKELVARWPSRTVLLEPHKLNLAQAPHVPQYIQLLLSFNVTVVYNTVDLVWLRNPLNSARGPFDVWVAEERPSDAMSAHPSGAVRAIRNSSQELGVGFMVFRPTHGSRLLLNMWIVEAMSEPSTNADGLVPFNKAVWALSSRQVLVGVLSPYVFMSGYVYFSCRRYRSLRNWHNMSCESTWSDKVTVVLNNSPIDSSGANSTTAARVQRLMDNKLWFVPDFEELMGLATDGMADASEDLGRSQAEREALVAKVLPGASTRHVDDGMTLAEAVEVVGGPSRTLIFCSASEGYLDFLINWFKSVQRAGQGDKVLFIAEDHVAYDFLRQRWPKQTVLVVDGPAGRGQPTPPERAVGGGGGGGGGGDANAETASLNGGSSNGIAPGAVAREEEDEAAVVTSLAGVSTEEAAGSAGKQGTDAAAAAGAEIGHDASSIRAVGEDREAVQGEGGVPLVGAGEEGEEGKVAEEGEEGADEKGRRLLLWKRGRNSRSRGGSGGASGSSSSSSTRGSAAHLFGTNIYNTLVDRRPKYFEALLLLNVTFLYNDVDIVWFRDAWPLFTGDYDMWVQEDRPRERSESEEKTTLASTASHAALRRASEYICTCIMMLRPTPGSLLLVRLWTHVLHLMQRRAGGKAVPNQPAFNMALQFTRQHDVRVGVLPIQLFPSGYLHFPCGALLGCSKMQRLQKRYWALKDSGTIRPAMVHNNWIKGYAAKLQRFKASKLWSVTASDVVPTRSPLSFPAPLVNSSSVKPVEPNTDQ